MPMPAVPHKPRKLNHYQQQDAELGPRTDWVPIYRPQDTLPKYVNVWEVISTAQATKLAVDRLGVTPYALQSLPGRIVKEGRGDAGANKFDTKNPGDVAIYDTLYRAGNFGFGATYPAAIAGAERRARQKGIPLDHAYNGTGKSPVGEGGAAYAADMKNYVNAVPADPRNAELMAIISRAVSGKLNSTEQDMMTPYDQDRIWQQSGRHITDVHGMVPLDKKPIIDAAGKGGFELATYITFRDRQLRGANDEYTWMADRWGERYPEATAIGESIRQQLGKEIAAKKAAAAAAQSPRQESLLDTIRNFASSFGL